MVLTRTQNLVLIFGFKNAELIYAVDTKHFFFFFARINVYVLAKNHFVSI